MQAFLKASPLALRPNATFGANGSESPQQSATATSGTYFKAVRPTAVETDALARGEPVIDGAKIEGLRFELEVGIWRGDSELIAGRVVDDAGCASGDDAE